MPQDDDSGLQSILFSSAPQDVGIEGLCSVDKVLLVAKFVAGTVQATDTKVSQVVSVR